MEKTGYVVIGLSVLLIACLAASFAAISGSNEAVRQALAEQPAPDTSNSQRSTNVCVGLNIGSCNVEQSSTATTTRSEQGDASPWEILFAIAGIVIGFVALVIWVFRPPPGNTRYLP